MNLGQYIAKQLLEQDKQTIALFPGAFKPPHKGHFVVVKKLLENADQVVVLVSDKVRGGITGEESVATWELYKKLLPSNVEIRTISGSPVSELYDIVKNNPDTDFIVAYGKEDGDRYKHITKYPNVQVFNAGSFEEKSSTAFRKAIMDNDIETIKDFIPKEISVEDFMKNIKGGALNESQDKSSIVKEFIKEAIQSLGINQPCHVKLTGDKSLTKTYGHFDPNNNSIVIYTGNRSLGDILRTLAHELVHHKQRQDNRITPKSGQTGPPIENEANAIAGILLRKFGERNPMIYEQKGKYKIYCDMDGVLVDFDKGYEDLTGQNIRNTFVSGNDFWEPISKAGSKFWSELEWMKDGKQLWDYIKKYNPPLLSAPSREESSRIGKQEWVDANLPGVQLILRAAEKKKEFANPSSILIDDREKNIKEWEEAGGIGILHKSASDTIEKLKKLGL